MQFSKKVSQLSRLYNINPKEVLFALLTSAGASASEAYAVIFRPASTTTSSLSTKASQLIGQKPGLRKLMDDLNQDPDNPDQQQPRRGRPRTKGSPDTGPEDVPIIDYTDKDALLKELARIAERAEKESDRLAALREIGALQRMKQEAAVEDEKRVTFYIPLSFDRCNELLEYLQQYYREKAANLPQ